jgi:hypothetical protein
MGRGRVLWLLLVLLGASSSQGKAQWSPGVRTLESGAFLTIGAGNTQFPYYADNALGFNFGAFVQRYTLLGVEVRGGTYPVAAKFTQSPVTAGLRVGKLHNGPGRLFPFAFIGGGSSWAQDSSALFKPTPAVWSRCWQASAGLDIQYRRYSVRFAEVSWTRTYTSRAVLRTPYLSGGIVYRFGRGSNE